MPKPQKRMSEEKRADELLEDLERLAEMFDKHDLKLQRKVTDTLRQAVEQQQTTNEQDQ
jgi:phage gpG-like protein